ncbi:MAG: endolytic transglycosylase MltG [Flammeovirgaceae bacterium]
MYYSPNFLLEREEGELFIPQNADFNAVVDSLKMRGYINDEVSFRFVARSMDYWKAVKPGRYLLKKKMSNMAVVKLLRSGEQTPVKVIFNNIRTLEELAPKICRNLQMTPDSFLLKTRDTQFIHKLGFTKETLPSMFIPNTYNVYWNITTEELFKRMKREYDKFWNEERKAKASALNMDFVQITTIASIVEAETKVESEKPTVAGLYINRLQQGIPLQSDPTVVFALGDFSIKRVLAKYLDIDSPYNTYKFKGLPPGPINIPAISSIDAVLNYEKHDYIYMCAKEDFSGTHNFSKTLAQHNEYARKYQKALSKRGIYK